MEAALGNVTGAVLPPPHPVGAIAAEGGRSASCMWGGVAGGGPVGSRTGDRGLSGFDLDEGAGAC